MLSCPEGVQLTVKVIHLCFAFSEEKKETMGRNISHNGGCKKCKSVKKRNSSA